MSQLPYASSCGFGGLCSIEEQELYLAPYIDHSNDQKITAITNMLDMASNDVSHGLEYLGSHQSDYRIEASVFFDDALHALQLSKNLHQNGLLAGDFLDSVTKELIKAKDQLVKTGK